MLLIVGEAGERPFEDSASATRLRGWLGVKDYAELKALASLTNVRRCMDGSTIIGHEAHVRRLFEAADHAILVGRVAQKFFGFGYAYTATTPSPRSSTACLLRGGTDEH